MTPPILGIVCGMQTEFDALGRTAIDPSIRVSVSGARPELAADGARWLLSEGCRVLMSWGVAGGLDPALAPGDLLLPNAVVTGEGNSYVTEPPDLGDLVAPGGTLIGTDRVVLTAAEKADLHRQSGARAVDMESHKVMEVAAEANVPAFVLRAVGDGAGTSLPPFVSDALSPTGHPLIFSVLGGLLRSPGSLPRLLRLKRDTDRGLRRLHDLTGAGCLDQILASFAAP